MKIRKLTYLDKTSKPFTELKKKHDFVAVRQKEHLIKSDHQGMLTFLQFKNTFKNLPLICRYISEKLFMCFQLPRILRTDCLVTSKT